MAKPEEILAFWLDEIGPKGWYAGGEALDQQIRDRYEGAWQAAMEGKFSLWLTYPSGTLAYIILTDQLPRNMFRDQGKAFASDGMARAAAKAALSKGWDKKIDVPARQFFYLPLMHSESLSDQDRCVRLMATRMDEAGDSNLLHARAHREVIRQYGRFPYRNAALGRHNTSAEQAFLVEGGYSSILNDLREQLA